MDQTKRLILPIPPSVNNYKQYVCTRSILHGPLRDIHEVRAYITPRAAQYKYDVGWEAKAAGLRMEEESDIAIEVHLYLGRHHIDTDNVLKLLLDALNGIAYKDDRQVSDIRIRRYRGTATSPHIEVVVGVTTTVSDAAEK